jgi:hypothetical protein
MSSWAEFAAEAPEFAARVRELFAIGTNKTIATVRADGSPRISGTEVEIEGDDVTLGMMPGSRKLADVERDPRVAIHSPTLEPPEDLSQWPGDAKVAGVLRERPVPEGGLPGSYFALDLSEVVHTRMNETGTTLVVESWHPGRGIRRIQRA